MRSYFFH